MKNVSEIRVNILTQTDLACYYIYRDVVWVFCTVRKEKNEISEVSYVLHRC